MDGDGEGGEGGREGEGAIKGCVEFLFVWFRGCVGLVVEPSLSAFPVQQLVRLLVEHETTRSTSRSPHQTSATTTTQSGYRHVCSDSSSSDLHFRFQVLEFDGIGTAISAGTMCAHDTGASKANDLPVQQTRQQQLPLANYFETTWSVRTDVEEPGRVEHDNDAYMFKKRKMH